MARHLEFDTTDDGAWVEVQNEAYRSEGPRRAKTHLDRTDVDRDAPGTAVASIMFMKRLDNPGQTLFREKARFWNFNKRTGSRMLR